MFSPLTICLSLLQLLSGAIDQDRASFYLWSVEKQRLRASMTHTGASCYDACNEALAVGCADGGVKVWSFSSIDGRRDVDANTLVNVAPTASISHRSSLGMMPFIRTRSKDKVTCVRLDDNDGSYLHLATSTEKGEANVWDVAKGEIIISIPASKIHKSTLPRSQREANPQITSLMLIRNTLVCGTSCGLIRVFDMRSSRLTHRLAGHPGKISILTPSFGMNRAVLTMTLILSRRDRQCGHEGPSALVCRQGRLCPLVGRQDRQDPVQVCPV